MARKRKTTLFGLRNNPDNVTKKMIVDFVADRTGQTKKATKEAIDAFLETVKTLAEAGGYITLSGFGTFRMEKRKGYTRRLTKKQQKMLGTNRKTMRVPARERLVFRASK